MKRVVVSLLVAGLVMGSAGVVRAQMGMMGGSIESEESHEHERLDEVLPEILGKYGVDTVEELNCDELSDEDFERLGDAVMEENHPGEEHERMDAMMGGEGSESLAAMHIQMGESYLGCDQEAWVEGDNYWGRGRMMALGGWGMQGWWGGNQAWVGLLYVLTVGFLVSGIIFFWRKRN